jgi:hypothetical protein
MSEFVTTALGPITLDKVLAAIRVHPERTTANALIAEQGWSDSSASRSAVLAAIGELREQGKVSVDGPLTANVLIGPIIK